MVNCPKLDEALTLAEAGFKVLPLAPNGKGPLTPHGYKDATTDPAVIKMWWRKYPDANIGLATGDEVVVVDVDVKNGTDGYLSLKQLQSTYGLLETARVKTPSGGEHIYLAKSREMIVPCRTNLLPGIDIRGEGGYVVAPGSTVNGKTYEWSPEHLQDGAAVINPAPEGLIGLLTGADRPTPPVPATSDEPKGEGDLERVRECVNALSSERSDDRDSWIRVGLALHNEVPGSEGLKIWEEFSRRSTKFKEGECAKLWRGFGANQKSDGPRLTLGSLIKWAREDSGDQNLGKLQSSSDDQRAGDAWDNPLPILEFDAPAFPSGILPPKLQRFCEGLAASIGIQVEMVALAVLAVLGAMLAKRVMLTVKSCYQEASNLFVLLVAEPGAGKSPVYRSVIAPVLAYEKELAEQASEACSQSSEQPEPVVQRLVAGDATPEAAKTLLSTNNGRLFITDSEETSISCATGRYSQEPKIEVFLQGHDGDEMRVDRKGRGAERIENPRLSMLIFLQLASLRNLGAKSDLTDRGFLGRCICVAPPSLVGFRPARLPDLSPELDLAYKEYVLSICRESAVREPLTLTLSPEAQEEHEQFRDWLEPQLRRTGRLGERVKGWGAKLESRIMRLTLILHVAWCAETGTDWGSAVSGDTYRRARILVDFLIPHAERMFAIASDDSEESNAEYILDYLKDKELYNITEADLRRTVKHRFKGRNKRDDFDAAIELLIDHGWLRRREAPKTGKPGRPKTSTLQVNPILFES